MAAVQPEASLSPQFESASAPVLDSPPPPHKLQDPSLPPSSVSPLHALRARQPEQGAALSTEQGREVVSEAVLPNGMSGAESSPEQSGAVEKELNDTDTSPLFLAIDSDTRKMRACLLSDTFEVVWVEQVDLDLELSEYGTSGGVYTLGEEVTSPSQLKIAALDLLLLKLAHNGHSLSRVKAVCGSTPAPASHFLSSNFENRLDCLHADPALCLTQALATSDVFSLQTPPTLHDSSTTSQLRDIELSVGASALHESESGARAVNDGESSKIASLGRQRLRDTTGTSLTTHHLAPQILKIRQQDRNLKVAGEAQKGIIEEDGGDMQAPTTASLLSEGWNGKFDSSWNREGSLVLDNTARIVTEGQLLSSMLLGRICPMTFSYAATTGLFNLQAGVWDSTLLEAIVGEDEGEKLTYSTERLKCMLGSVEDCECKAIGVISSYFVDRFGLSPDCIVMPFLPSTAATYLSHTFDSDQRDVIACLGVDGSDCIITPLQEFRTSPDWSVLPSPLRGAVTSDKSVSEYIAVLWLDDKCFSFFFPSLDKHKTVSQGFSRFSNGVRTFDFNTRSINPRLLLESQYLSLRVRLARLLAVDDELDSTLDAPLGFSSSSQATLPSRLILCGAAASNPAMVALLSTVMNAPAYFLDPTTELARSTHGTRPELSDDLEGDDRAYATSSGYGAALFAAWVLARSADEGQADVGFQEYVAQKREQSWSSSPSAAAPERDSEGITLVAQPDATEHRYYNSMLREFVRLETNARRGFI